MSYLRYKGPPMDGGYLDRPSFIATKPVPTAYVDVQTASDDADPASSSSRQRRRPTTDADRNAPSDSQPPPQPDGRNNPRSDSLPPPQPDGRNNPQSNRPAPPPPAPPTPVTNSLVDRLGSLEKQMQYVQAATGAARTPLEPARCRGSEGPTPINLRRRQPSRRPHQFAHQADGSCMGGPRTLSSDILGRGGPIRLAGRARPTRFPGGTPIMTPARRAIPVFLVLGLAGSLAIGTGRRSAGQEADDVVTREAVCRWATKPPVLDGKLDDRAGRTRWRSPSSPRTGTTRRPGPAPAPTWSGTTRPSTTAAR